MTAENAFGLTVNNDVLMFLELTMAVNGIAFFHDDLRYNERVYWDLTEFRYCR